MYYHSILRVINVVVSKLSGCENCMVLTPNKDDVKSILNKKYVTSYKYTIVVKSEIISKACYL